MTELRNGSLLIDSVEDSDDGNYTCRAENRYGSDEVVIALSVKGQLVSYSVALTMKR